MCVNALVCFSLSFLSLSASWQPWSWKHFCSFTLKKKKNEKQHLFSFLFVIGFRNDRANTHKIFFVDFTAAVAHSAHIQIIEKRRKKKYCESIKPFRQAVKANKPIKRKWINFTRATIASFAWARYNKYTYIYILQTNIKKIVKLIFSHLLSIITGFCGRLNVDASVSHYFTIHSMTFLLFFWNDEFVFFFCIR